MGVLGSLPRCFSNTCSGTLNSHSVATCSKQVTLELLADAFAWSRPVYMRMPTAAANHRQPAAHTYILTMLTSTPTLPVSHSASSARSKLMPMSSMAVKKRWLTCRLTRLRSLAVRVACTCSKSQASALPGPGNTPGQMKA